MDATHADMLKRRFGERIRVIREMRGWQLEDLAARIEKSVATLSRIENGKQNLTMVDIAVIAQNLEIFMLSLTPHSFDTKHVRLIF